MPHLAEDTVDQFGPFILYHLCNGSLQTLHRYEPPDYDHISLLLSLPDLPSWPRRESESLVPLSFFINFPPRLLFPLLVPETKKALHHDLDSDEVALGPQFRTGPVDSELLPFTLWHLPKNDAFLWQCSKEKQTETSSSMSESLTRMCGTSSIIAGSTGMGLAPA